MAFVYTWIRNRMQSRLEQARQKLVMSARLYDKMQPEMKMLVVSVKRNAVEKVSNDETFSAFLSGVLQDATTDKESFDWIELYKVVFSFCVMHNAHSVSFSFAEFLIRRQFLSKDELRDIMKKFPSLFHPITTSLL